MFAVIGRWKLRFVTRRWGGPTEAPDIGGFQVNVEPHGAELYINGALDVPTASSDAEIGTLTGNNTVIIGKGGKDTGGSWDGHIDEVRIYSAALAPEDITQIKRGDLSLA